MRVRGLYALAASFCRFLYCICIFSVSLFLPYAPINPQLVYRGFYAPDTFPFKARLLRKTGFPSPYSVPSPFRRRVFPVIRPRSFPLPVNRRIFPRSLPQHLSRLASPRKCVVTFTVHIIENLNLNFSPPPPLARVRRLKELRRSSMETLKVRAA